MWTAWSCWAACTMEIWGLSIVWGQPSLVWSFLLHGYSCCTSHERTIMEISPSHLGMELNCKVLFWCMWGPKFNTKYKEKKKPHPANSAIPHWYSQETGKRSFKTCFLRRTSILLQSKRGETWSLRGSGSLRLFYFPAVGASSWSPLPLIASRAGPLRSGEHTVWQLRVSSFLHVSHRHTWSL